MPTTRGSSAAGLQVPKTPESLTLLRNPLFTSVNKFRKKLAATAAFRNVLSAIKVNLRFLFLHMSLSASNCLILRLREQDCWKSFSIAFVSMQLFYRSFELTDCRCNTRKVFPHQICSGVKMSYAHFTPLRRNDSPPPTPTPTRITHIINILAVGLYCQ